MTYDIFYDIGMMSEAIIRSIRDAIMNQSVVHGMYCTGYVPDAADEVGPRTIVISAGALISPLIGMKFHPSESHLFLAFYSGEITPFIPASCYPLRTKMIH